MLFVVCVLLCVAPCLIFVVGRVLLVRCLFVVFWLLHIVVSSLCVVCCVLLVVRRVLCIVYYSLYIEPCLSFDVCRSLRVGCCSLCVCVVCVLLAP